MYNIKYEDLAKALLKIRRYSNVDKYQFSSILNEFDILAEKKDERNFDRIKWEQLLIEHKVLDENGEI